MTNSPVTNSALKTLTQGFLPRGRADLVCVTSSIAYCHATKRRPDPTQAGGKKTTRIPTPDSLTQDFLASGMVDFGDATGTWLIAMFPGIHKNPKVAWRQKDAAGGL